MDELLAKHAKEKRDLASKVAQKKKSATKKTRKGVNDDCERLERELGEKQAAEIQELEPGDPNQLDSAVENLSIDETADEHGEAGGAFPEEVIAPAAGSQPPSEGTCESQPRTKKPNRQKARLARRAADQEAAASEAALEAKNQPDRREQEMSAMKKQMETLKLRETLIRPDGHCLFSACAYGMPSGGAAGGDQDKEPYQRVRSSAAAFMASHPDDFSPFLEEPWTPTSPRSGIQQSGEDSWSYRPLHGPTILISTCFKRMAVSRKSARVPRTVQVRYGWLITDTALD